MKPEMNMMNLLPGAGKSMKNTPGPKAAKLLGANNPKSAENIPEEGVGVSVTQKSQDIVFGARFKKILEAVAKANKQAVDKDAKDGTFSALPVDYNKLSTQLAAMGLSPADLGLNATDQTDKEMQLAQASDIIKNAIAKISKMLNIKINQGLENLQMVNPSQNVIDQFADILSALKGIASLLDDAVKNNQPIEISGKVFDVSQAAEVGQELRVETFHIEVALEMAGVSGDVAQSTAQKNNQPSGNGIVTALDPALISMPDSQVNQVLGSVLNTKEQNVEALFAKLAETLKGNGASDKTQLVNKIAALATGVDAKNVQVETVLSTAGEAKTTPALDPGTLDSKILRALLKIDTASEKATVDSKAASMLLKADTTKAGNVIAANTSEKMDLSKTMKIILAKEITGADQSGDGKLGTMLAGADAAKGPASSLLAMADLRSSALPRTIEESVMNQLTDKVQTALKTGVTEIRLLLRPESLGEMRVKLTMDGDVVMGKIYVESQQVKHIVESNLQTLKDCLAQHNLQTGSFDVNVGGGAREQLQEMAAMSLQNGTEKRNDLTENPENPTANKDVSAGQETGRRFGTNTIEYFG
jgi:Flagellar hook-length control protein